MLQLQINANEMVKPSIEQTKTNLIHYLQIAMVVFLSLNSYYIVPIFNQYILVCEDHSKYIHFSGIFIQHPIIIMMISDEIQTGF